MKGWSNNNGLIKRFDSLNHDLLLAKLKAHGLNNSAVSFTRTYLRKRLQRCKINDSFRKSTKISVENPQGSILGPLLFNIFINDIFLFLQKCDLANYANDSILSTSDKHVSTIIVPLRHELTILSKRFCNKSMVLNLEKCSFMLLGVDN